MRCVQSQVQAGSGSSPSPGPVFGAPTAITSAPSGPPLMPRITCGGTRTALHGWSSRTSSPTFILPLVPMSVRLGTGREAKVAHTAVLTSERHAPEADVELGRVDPEVVCLVVELGQVDVAVLRHWGSPCRV